MYAKIETYRYIHHTEKELIEGVASIWFCVNPQEKKMTHFSARKNCISHSVIFKSLII